MSTCYMCNDPESSREHVPPLCFFPEERTYGRNLRMNLISVPSCNIHNSGKSQDDEFFRATVTMLAGNNEAGHHQFLEKTLRAARRRPTVYRSFFQDRGSVTAPPGPDLRALRLDRSRLDRCVDHLVRGLLFHATGTRWLSGVSVFLPNLVSTTAPHF